MVTQPALTEDEHASLSHEIRDAEAAGKAGIAFGAVTWGQHRQEILCSRNPAEKFTTVQEIADKLC